MNRDKGDTVVQSGAGDRFGRRLVLTDDQMAAAHRAGLAEHEAARQFRQRTVAECVIYMLCWAVLVTVSLPADRQAVRWTGYPHRTTTVINDPIQPGALLLQWIDPGGGLHDYTPGAYDHFTLGQHVQIVDSPAADCGWETPSEADGGIVAMIVIMGVLPLAGFGLLIVHRRRLWRRLLKTSAYQKSTGHSVSLYKAPWRTFIAVHTLGRTYYVPLMRDQRVESLERLELLQPLVTATRRAQVPFRIAGTDRVVWPGGGCHTSVWPIAQMTFTVVRVFGPVLLLPFVHWVTSTPGAC